ncbi:tRNA 4-thiouridine(8) synthase ThiI [Candidatus Pacearchaeota archaeon]|nr:tRNA 4-thiouridine(8) synthase ThiI [Candidatus Pacearchaeota archaeon]
MKNKKPKALVLFSGGLDSRIVIKIMQELGIKTEAVYFRLPFPGYDNKLEDFKKFLREQKVKLHIIDVSKKPLFNSYLKTIKKPEHGYGSAMNPCKDCKIFMFKQVKKLAKEIKADIISTGEVIDQRPMSQKKKDLMLIEKKSRLKGKILRPLSAGLLAETIYEKNKLITRNQLYSIIGRTRKKQIQLAKKFKINYPDPAGGCILCEKNYSKKLKKIFEKRKIAPEDLKLIKYGRLFKKNSLIILGRHNQDNKALKKLSKNNHIIIPKKPGPTAVFFNKKDKPFVRKLIKAYSSKTDIENFERYKV